jgi:FtsP/CotA-like multicopper oxidase with cupredoxin domain
MTYYVDGRAEPNPQLRLRAGERVRLTLRNEDEGMQHDFTIRAWGVGTETINGKGGRTVVFRAPDKRAATAYSCTPHAAMMSGDVVVE